MAEFFNKWKQALNRSSKAAFGRLATVFGATEITLSTWDELEALLIQADLGIDTTNEIIASLMQRVDRDGITSAQELTPAQVDDLVAGLKAKFNRAVDVQLAVDPELIGGISQIGIIFLLFLLGLNLPFDKLSSLVAFTGPSGAGESSGTSPTTRC